MKLPVRAGILGGGQLAKMLAISAYGLGVKPLIFAASKNDCALDAVAEFVIDDGTLGALKNFLAKCDLAVIENEFIDLLRLKNALGKTPLFPSLDCLEMVQNKLHQKTYLQKFGIPTLDFIPIKNMNDYDRCVQNLGPSLVFKREKMGFDGRGNFVCERFNKKKFLKTNSFFTGYAEPFVDFKIELAVVGAVSINGEISVFPTIETVQKDGQCHFAIVPADISEIKSKNAQEIAIDVMKRFGATGVFAVEMFYLRDGRLVVNEIAPRVHNSGHLTMNGFGISQFELHWRAVLGMSLPKKALLPKSPSLAMVNIIGKRKIKTVRNEAFNFSKPGRKLRGDFWIHWYGKWGGTFNRKLGHINCTGISVKQTLKTAQRIRNRIKI